MRLPFKLIPAHWGLSGKSLELAKIDYYIKDPYEAEMARAKLIDDDIERQKTEMRIDKKYSKITDSQYEVSMINLNNELISEVDYKKAVLQIRKKYKELSEREYMESELELMPDSKEKELMTLALLYKYHEITEDDYQKGVATINEKVWWKLTVTSDSNEEVEVSLDYNEFFVKTLQETGHPGNDENEIVDFYVKDLGRKLATGESSDYDSRLLQANLDDPKMIIRGISNGDGTVDYS